MASIEDPKLMIDNCLANIAQYLPAFKHRPTQHQMISAVSENFSQLAIEDRGELQDGSSILIVEGPTGTGKSLSYLLPAVVMARARDKRLIVSSATVALQEQLANKDIPLLAKHAGLDISYAIAKGRGRYACTYRLKQQAGITQKDDSQLQLELSASESATSINSHDMFFEMSELLSEGEWSGDRDSLPTKISDGAWAQITNDRHGCLKKNCPEFAACPFYTARQTLDNVDIIIANHDLLLADIAMGGGVILPDPTETFYCLDEAHHLADKAIKQFAASHTINGTLSWLEKLDIAVSKALAQLGDYRPAVNIHNQTESLVEYLQDLREALSNFAELRHQFMNDVIVLRFKHGRVPDSLTLLSESLAVTTKILHTSLYLLHDNLKKGKARAEGSGESALFDRPLSDIGFFLGRMENLVAVLSLFSQQSSANVPPIA